MSAPRMRAMLVAAGLVAGLSACSATTANGPADVLDSIEAREQAEDSAVAPASAGAAAASACSPKPEVSYAKLPSVPATPPAGSLVAAIKARDYMVVGVSGDTRLLGARDRLTDDDPKGFDIEIAKSIGRAIFGEDGHVRFKVITAGQRFPQVNAGVEKNGVDMVARAVSMTCERWSATDPTKGSAFSVAYLQSDQRVLVRKGVTSLAALAKSKPDGKAQVCAPAASTSLGKITGKPDITPIAVAIHSDCLALWQAGKVDAITGDDVILAGFQNQDRTAVILGGEALDTTPYGLAIAKNQPYFVQYVNAVMATPQFRADWQEAYRTYLSDALAADPQSLPQPQYGRALKG